MTVYSRWQPHRNSFWKALRSAGFAPVEAEGATDAWAGGLDVEWTEPTTGIRRMTRHQVRIELPAAFPFQKVRVVPLDALPIQDERHQEPGIENGALCLYPDDGPGWSSWTNAEEAVERIRRWFVHHHQDDWPPGDRPPDLHMYYPRQGSLALMLYGDDWRPPGGEPAGLFAYWTQPRLYRAFVANPVTLDAVPARFTTDRIAPILGIAGVPSAGRGTWFRLGREPIPRPTLQGVLEDVDLAAGMTPGWALQLLNARLGRRIRGKDHQLVIALGYPAEQGQEWLFLGARLPASRKNDAPWVRRAAQIAVESFAAASVGRDALMRRTGHTARELAGRTVCVFGVGAVGSSVAMLLGKAGVERMRVLDHDTLRPGNAVRHAAGLAYAGLPKVQALRSEAAEHFPDASVETGFGSWDPDVLGRWVADADVVVDATANPAFSFLLNELGVQAGRPVIYVATYRRAAVGRVQIVRPGTDACLVCRAARHAADPSYTEIPAGDDGAFLEGGCGVPTVEASAVDVEASANVAARAALHVMAGKNGADNECLIVNEPLAGAAGLLGMRGHTWTSWAPVPECETCGQPTR